MTITLTAGDAAELAQMVSNELPNVSPTARELYRVLVEVAARVEQARGHAPTVTESVLHLPLELLSDVVGVSRMTVWRRLPELRELGVVDHRVHKATWRCGDRTETRNSGTVFRVRLSPLRGPRARVSADDLRHKHRGRVMFGAASKRVLLRTRNIQDRAMKILECVNWAVSPGLQPHVISLCNRPAQSPLEALLDLTTSKREDRRALVDRAALAMTQALSDAGSLNWYRKLCWSLLRRYDAGQDVSYAVYLQAKRAQTDQKEGFARKAGALFVSRMKTAPWFAELVAPPARVT